MRFVLIGVPKNTLRYNIIRLTRQGGEVETNQYNAKDDNEVIIWFFQTKKDVEEAVNTASKNLPPSYRFYVAEAFGSYEQQIGPMVKTVIGPDGEIPQ